MTGLASAALLPPALVPGSAMRVIAPSGPFDAEVVTRGIAWLASRYDVRSSPGIFESRGYLAGSDARRAAELEEALVEPGVAAIVCARGGYGASRFVHRVDWSRLRDAPRWIVGFSDVTALHVEAAAVGVASIHGPNVTALGREDDAARSSFIDALEQPHRRRVFEGLESLVAGEGEGVLYGGNLALLHACAAAGRLSVPDGAVLFLEDVTERPYRIDRMLTTLLTGGHLRTVRGVVLGDFTECSPGPDGIRVHEVIGEVLGGLGVPIASGVPAGHGSRNEPLVLGGWARITSEGGTARFDLAAKP